MAAIAGGCNHPRPFERRPVTRRPWAWQSFGRPAWLHHSRNLLRKLSTPNARPRAVVMKVLSPGGTKRTAARASLSELNVAFPAGFLLFDVDRTAPRTSSRPIRTTSEGRWAVPRKSSNASRAVLPMGMALSVARELALGPGTITGLLVLGALTPWLGSRPIAPTPTQYCNMRRSAFRNLVPPARGCRHRLREHSRHGGVADALGGDRPTGLASGSRC